MTWSSLLVSVLGVAAVVFVCWLAWFGLGDIDAMRRFRWPRRSPAQRRHTVRCMPAMGVIAVPVLIAWGLQDTTIGVILMWSVVPAGCLYGSVYYWNRPKWIVPPRFRGDRGRWADGVPR